MAQVKTYRIRGEIKKPNSVMNFLKEIAAIGEKQAIEKIYSLFGSRHHAKRFQMKIISIEELNEQVGKNGH